MSFGATFSVPMKIFSSTTKTLAAMARLDPEFCGKAGRAIAVAIARFDPTFCGKVIRIVAAISVVEFLSAIVLLAVWVPADSGCRAWAAPKGATVPIYSFIFAAGGAALWVCVLAIFWKHFARLFSAFSQSEQRQSGPGQMFFPFRQVRINTALLTAVFVCFAGFVAIPFFMIIQQCGS